VIFVACGADGVASQPDAAIASDAQPADASLDAAPGTAIMRVHYDVGAGHRIALRGDGPGLSWTAGVDCTWTTGNVWECPVEAVTQPFEVKPLVDDTTWARGTNWKLAGGAALDVYPNFTGTQGRFTTHAAVASAHLSRTRDVVVYLPPSYDENPAKRYPLVIMHDGQNLYDPATATFGTAWEIDAAMNDLVANAGIHEAIIAGVYNTPDRIDEYTPTVDDGRMDGGNAAAYVQFLREELVPLLTTTYRTDGARAGIAGSSLGGLVTLYACWEHPDVFDRCGVFSPSLWWDGQQLAMQIAADSATAAQKPLAIYLDSGDSGPSMDGMTDTAAMRDTLTAKGFVLGEDLHYVLGAGQAHNEAAWAARAPNALRFLLRDPDRAP